ncbi:AAA domain-containing protein, partial [Cephalotus follicularis]
FSVRGFPSTTSVLSTYTTFTASAMLVPTVVKEMMLLTSQFQEIIMSKCGHLFGNLSSKMTLIITVSKGLRDKKLSLTISKGLLNFIDGLWSSCGAEKIIVFTTNHKDRLDPALLRPGRMDMHIHMSYCTPGGFKTLASNYLGVISHNLLPHIDGLLREVEATPAEIAEELMKSEDPDIALTGGLISFLQSKKTRVVGCKRRTTKGSAGNEKAKRIKRKSTLISR